MNKKNIPVLPLRDIVVFPHMVAPLFVGRKMSINALNKVMLGDKKILLITQKSSDIDNPSPKNLYNFGTVAKILQLLNTNPLVIHICLLNLLLQFHLLLLIPHLTRCTTRIN